MESKRRAISPLLYYTILSGLTSFTFVVILVIVLALFSLKITDNIGVMVLAVLLLWKGVLVGFIVWLIHKTANFKEFGVKFIGLYLGRFFGLFIGGFLGSEIANWLRLTEIIGIILGALAFYFIGWWIGSKVSIKISGQLDKLFSMPEIIGSKEAIKPKLLIRTFYIMAIIVIPLLFVGFGLLINYFGIQVGYLIEWLPIARIIVIAISIFSIWYPWFMRRRWSIKYQSAPFSKVLDSSWLGISISIIPSVYGLILFVVMGASIIELCLFSAASSIAAIIWIVNNPILREQAPV